MSISSRCSRKRTACHAPSPSPSTTWAAPIATANSSSGSSAAAAGRYCHSAQSPPNTRRPRSPNSSPNRTPKTIAHAAPICRIRVTPASTGVRAAAERRARNAKASSTTPYPTSPTIAPNISGKNSASSSVGSTEPGRGSSRKRASGSNGRARRGLRISNGASGSRGDGARSSTRTAAPRRETISRRSRASSRRGTQHSATNARRVAPSWPTASRRSSSSADRPLQDL